MIQPCKENEYRARARAWLESSMECSVRNREMVVVVVVLRSGSVVEYMVDIVVRVEGFRVVNRGRRPFSSIHITVVLHQTLYMVTHLHPPTSSSPLDLVREGFNLFVLGSGSQ